MEATLIQLIYNLQAVAFVVLISAICLLFPRINYRAQLARLPILNGAASSEEQRKAFLESAHHLYLDGYKKVRIIVNALLRLQVHSSRMLFIACQPRMVRISRRMVPQMLKCYVPGVQHIVIPPRFLSEVRKLPDSVLVFYAAAEKVLGTNASQSRIPMLTECKVLETRYTGVLTDLSMVAHSVRSELTPALGDHTFTNTHVALSNSLQPK